MFRRALIVLLASVGVATPASAQGQPREGYVHAGNGVRIFYRVAGNGSDTVIVLHGGPGFTSDYLDKNLDPLGRRHTLIFFDQRGTGRSTLVTDSVALDACERRCAALAAGACLVASSSRCPSSGLLSGCICAPSFSTGG